MENEINDNHEANLQKANPQEENIQSAVELEIAKTYVFRKKIISTVLPVVLGVMALIGVVVCYVSFDAHRDEKYLQLEQTASMYANDIKNMFYGYYRVGNHYYSIIQNFKKVDVNDRRKYYENLTKKFLENNPTVHSFWVDFDKNTFDGLDAKYRNVGKFNETGRFCKLYYRDYRGKIISKPTFQTEEIMCPDAEFVSSPKKLKKPTVLDPYSFIYDHENRKETEKLITSICFPIFENRYDVENSDIIGVTGIDILLETLINKVENQNPYGINNIAVISSAYNVLTHYDTFKFGTHYSNTSIFNTLNWDTIHSQLQEYKTFNLTMLDKNDDTKKIIYFVPIELNTTGSSLTLEIVFNYDEIMSDAWAFVFDIMLYFIVALFLVAVAIFLFSTFLYNSVFNRVAALRQLIGNFIN